MMAKEELRKLYLEAGLDPDEYIPIMQRAEKYKEDYYNVFHVCCPNCGNDKYSSTYVGYIVNPSDLESFKDENDVGCKCGWTGITHDLVSRNE